MKRQQRQGLTVSVPWPVRLFGDGQEEFGLPSISVALSLRTAIRAIPRKDGLHSVAARGLSSPVRFDPHAEDPPPKSIPSLCRALRALQPYDLELERGFDFEVHTLVPKVEKILDSPALTVAWIVVLLALHDRIKDLSGYQITALASGAFKGDETYARAVPDVCTCVLGGTLFIRGGATPKIAQIERALPGLVLVHSSGRPRSLPSLRGLVHDTREAVESMQTLFEGFHLAETSLDEAVARLRELPRDALAGMLYAQLSNRDICLDAHALMEKEYGLDDDRIGEMLDQSRETFRDYLGYEAPALEKLIAAARQAGALGCKLNLGANSFLAFAPGHEEDVIAAIRRAGGYAQEVAVAEGMSVDA